MCDQFFQQENVNMTHVMSYTRAIEMKLETNFQSNKYVYKYTYEVNMNYDNFIVTLILAATMIM